MDRQVEAGLPNPIRARSKALAGKPAQMEAWQAWRIADGRFDPFSAVGAWWVGRRWDSPGLGVIHASRIYAGAMLECLAHAGIGRVPLTHAAVEIAIAASVSLERHDATTLPIGWDSADLHVARACCDAWIRDRSTAVLFLPSVVARREGNVLIDPQHPDFSGGVAGTPEPVVWDARLSGAHCTELRSRVTRGGAPLD